MSHQTLEELFRRYRGRLTRYLTRRGTSADLAADITQETFLRLLSAGHEPEMHAPEGYLTRAAANTAIDHHRRERRQMLVPLPDALSDSLPDSTPSAESVLLSREEVAVLRQAIAELPPRGREVFLMHKFDGLGYAEIAARLGIAKNTVMVHMVRSLAHCRKRLDDHRRDCL